MPCPSDAEFEQFLTAALPVAAEEQIAEHLVACPPCCRRVERLSSGSAGWEIGPGGEAAVAAARADGTSGSDEATHADSDDWRGDLYRSAAGDQAPAATGAEPAARLFRLLTAGPGDEVAGTPIGRFTIRRWLGAGGYGVVFLADDELLHRQVALKLPRAEALARREVRRRFLREAEAAAQLHHPNLVPVHEAGEVDGVCYIASGYCPGPTLSAWLARHSEPVPVATAVEIVRQLAEGLQHAHDHHVLHRDLKPSNVLLETAAGAEPAAGEQSAPTPKVTDFGLAKWLDADISMSGSHEMLGTPRYMAPEQAGGGRLAVGPPTDVFGLGAILYELLTGRAPFAGDDHAQTLHRLLYESVVPPARRRSEVPRDLDAICLKCLEKKAKDRYPTAKALAEDLRRFQEGRTTRARPIRTLERLRRWAVRQPALAALMALVTTILFGLLGVFVAYNRSLESFNADMRAALAETHQAQRAMDRQRTRLRHLLYVSKIKLAYQAIGENDLPQASKLLRGIRAEAPDLADGFVWRYLWSRVAAEGHEIDACGADIYDLQYSPSGDRLAACGADGVVRVYDGATFERQLSFATDQGEVNHVAFSPDGRWLATAGDDGTVRLWNAETAASRRTIQAHPRLAFGVEFTPDGSTLISCGRDSAIRLWDVATGAPVRALEGHRRGVEAIALSPDGTELASAGMDNVTRIWDLDSGECRHALRGHQHRVVGVAYSADGKSLLTGSLDHTIRLWCADDGDCLQVARHVDPIASVAFHRQIDRLLAIDRAGVLHMWRRQSLKRGSGAMFSWKAHAGRAWKVIAVPNQSGALTAGADGKIQHWNKPPELPHTLSAAPDETIEDVVFDADSTRLHLLQPDQGVRTWDPASDETVSVAAASRWGDRRPVALELCGDGTLTGAFADGTVEGVAVSPQGTRLRLETPWPPGKPSPRDDLAASRTGQRLAVFSFAHDATAVFDKEPSEWIGTFEADSHSMALSDDGRRLAMSDADDVVVWDVDRRRLLHRFQGHTNTIVSLQFSPDGRWLASGSHDRQIRLWDLEGSREPRTLSGHRGEIASVAFSSCGRVLASGDERGELKFWFLPEAAELVSVPGDVPIRRLRFSRDGNRLAVQTECGIRIFDAGTDALVSPYGP